jgi:hypothetical protein
MKAEYKKRDEKFFYEYLNLQPEAWIRINDLVDAWEYSAAMIVSFAVFKLLPTDPRPVFRDILKEGVVSDMHLEELSDPDFLQRYEQLQKEKQELTKTISDTNLFLYQCNENLKRLPTWVERVLYVKNNLNRTFDDVSEELKWEKKKKDLISKHPEVEYFFDPLRRDREITDRIAKRNKAEKSLGLDYNKEMEACGSRIGAKFTRVRLVHKGPRESEPRDDVGDAALIKKCYDISGVNTPDELLELLARVRELKEGQLHEVEYIKDVEETEALLTEKKRKLSAIRHSVSTRKHAIYDPRYLDLKVKTPKSGKREREEKRAKKLLGLVTKLHFDNVASGSNR